MDEQQLAEMFAACERRMRTALQALTDAQDILNDLRGVTKRRLAEKDANGEPTWIFAVKTRIPPSIYLSKAFLAYAIEWGFLESQARILFDGAAPGSGSSYEGFVRYYERTGVKWSNWTKVWQKWVRTSHEKQQQKANGTVTRFDQQRTRA